MEKLFSDEQLEYLRGRSVLIATPFYMSQGYAQYFHCLLNTVRILDKMGIENDFLSINGDSYIDRARNTIVSKFLQSKHTELFFIDSDMEWDVFGFLRMLASPYDFVGSAYPMKNNWENYCVKHYSNTDGTPACTPDGLIISSLVPGGFLKLSKYCLTKMTAIYAATKTFKNKSNFYDGDSVNLFEIVTEDGIRYGEDTEFCRKWIKIGGEIFCEPRVTFSHTGVHSWTGNYHEFLLRQPKPGVKYGTDH